jgi:hypothetical protein
MGMGWRVHRLRRSCYDGWRVYVYSSDGDGESEMGKRTGEWDGGVGDVHLMFIKLSEATKLSIEQSDTVKMSAS